MSRVLLCLAAGGLILAARPAVAAEPPVAEASTGWQVDAGTDRCLALRRYMVGNRPVLLGFQPQPLHNSGQFTFRIEDRAHRVQYGPRGIKLFVGGRLLTTFASVQPAPSDGALITTGYSLKPPEKAILAGENAITLRSLQLTATFPLGPIDALNATLDRCNADLLATWGFSREEQARMATPPSWPKQGMFTAADYPKDILKQDRSGVVAVRFRVDATGRASDCVVRRSSGVPSLDERTCAIIVQRGQFGPARDRAGQPMAAVETGTVVWLRLRIFHRIMA